MLKEYTIKDICPALSKQVLNYVCPLEKIDQIGLAWPHKRNFYSITWFTEGNGTAIIDFAEYSIQPNSHFWHVCLFLQMCPSQIDARKSSLISYLCIYNYCLVYFIVTLMLVHISNIHTL